MSTAAASHPERVLGKYHIVRPLKIGGTAAIYLAIMRGENNFSREVVIKRPLPHLMADPRSRLMFMDEAHIAARLSHPNICQVLDLVARDDETYLVLEYLRGVDLREILKRCFELNRYMPPEVAVWIAIEIAAGLDFAHEAVGLDGQPLNLVHRDLSPKNIRITYSGAVKVIDFGIARAMNRATETAAGTIKGTLGYMSPEQILGDDIDCRSDIFAFGICLFQMLTARNPFDGPTLKERVKRLTQSPIPTVREFQPALDDEIAAIVARALLRDVNERYQKLREIQADLDRYLARLGVVSPRQKLIQFLEEIFPNHNEVDPDLNSALSSVSGIGGKIDTEQRLRFPDDPPTESNVHMSTGVTSPATNATQPGAQPADNPATRPTVDPGEAPTKRPRGPSGSEAHTRYNDTAITPSSPPPATRRTALYVGGFLAFSAAVAVVTFLLLPETSIESIDTVVPPPPPPPPIAVVTPPPPPPPPPTSVNTINTPPPPPSTNVKPPPPSKDPGPNDKDKARLYFFTARHLERQSRGEDAELLYHLAFANSGKNPDPNLYLNLGLHHDRSQNLAKARACLRGYLERQPDSASADQVRTKLSTYPSTKSVPCVDAAELAAAKRDYGRRGAKIDNWVDDAMKSRLK